MPQTKQYATLTALIAHQLVKSPDRVAVIVVQEDAAIDIQLIVHPADLGHVIGKQGRIARSIRTILGAAAMKDCLTVKLNIRAEEL